MSTHSAAKKAIAAAVKERQVSERLGVERRFQVWAKTANTCRDKKLGSFGKVLLNAYCMERAR